MSGRERAAVSVNLPDGYPIYKIMKLIIVSSILALTVWSANAQSPGPKELTCTETAVAFRFNVGRILNIDKPNVSNPDGYHLPQKPGGKNLRVEEYGYPRYALFQTGPNGHYQTDSLSSASYLFKHFHTALFGQHTLFEKKLVPSLFEIRSNLFSPGDKPLFSTGFTFMPFKEFTY
jgi:hypothetical protein